MSKTVVSLTNYYSWEFVSPAFFRKPYLQLRYQGQQVQNAVCSFESMEIFELRLREAQNIASFLQEMMYSNHISSDELKVFHSSEFHDFLVAMSGNYSFTELSYVTVSHGWPNFPHYISISGKKLNIKFAKFNLKTGSLLIRGINPDTEAIETINCTLGMFNHILLKRTLRAVILLNIEHFSRFFNFYGASIYDSLDKAISKGIVILDK